MEKSKGPQVLPPPQLNHLIKRNQDAKVPLTPVHNLARALVPAHPTTGIMPQRGGETGAEADHDRHIVPDTLGGAWQDKAVTWIRTATVVA